MPLFVLRNYNIMNTVDTRGIIRGGTTLLDVAQILEHVGVKVGSIVADLGCGGGGHFVIATAKIVGPGGVVYALDVQKRVLEIVKNRIEFEEIENTEFVWSNLEIYNAAKIPDGACDYAFLVNVLFQNKNLAGILKESLRVIKTGGRLVVIDWSGDDLHFGPPLGLRIPIERVRQLIAEHVVHEVDEFEASPYHYGLVIMK